MCLCVAPSNLTYSNPKKPIGNFFDHYCDQFVWCPTIHCHECWPPGASLCFALHCILIILTFGHFVICPWDAQPTTIASAYVTNWFTDNVSLAKLVEDIAYEHLIESMPDDCPLVYHLHLLKGPWCIAVQYVCHLLCPHVCPS